MQRRTIYQLSLAAGAASALGFGQETDTQQPLLADLEGRSVGQPAFIATWPFGLAACQRSAEVISAGGSVLDAVEKGIHVTELDTRISSVGYGGLPNANGVVQLDASFMDGTLQQAGAVCALEGYPNPISVARRVMESTKHVMLAGDDAAAFAKRHGFKERDMLTPKAREAWMRWKANQEPAASQDGGPGHDHDTIALLGLDGSGHLAGGCSTSGLAFKLPGRVGDSPLIGGGLYVDGKVGAAGATGVGENILRYCGSFLVVEFMRQGLTPTEACKATIRRIADGEQRDPSELSVNFVAINRDGKVGAAGTDRGFRCAVVGTESADVYRPTIVR